MDKINGACGCLPFYYPDVKDITTCDFKGILCLSGKYEQTRSEVGKKEACPNQCNQMSFRVTANSVDLKNFEYTFDKF